MSTKIRFNVARLITATTILAIAAALAFHAPSGPPGGAWSNAADFALFCLVFTTPLLALAVLLGRTQFWLVVALGMIGLFAMLLMVVHQ
jgi:hypothetical protein